MLSNPSKEASEDKPPTARPAGTQEEGRSFGDAKAHGASVIHPEVTVEGSISGGDEILVDGVVKGDVRVNHVIVGPDGRVEGGVFGDLVEVKGRVSGTITGKQVRLFSAAKVQADITHEQLAIENGATFEGRSVRLQRTAPKAG